MTLPAELQPVLEQKLGARISRTDSVSGGCISETARLELADGQRAFVKWAHTREHSPGLFRAEATSLRAIARTETVRVPAVIDVVESSTDYSFLILEWLEPGTPTTESWATLGMRLAELHQNRNENFGWIGSNFIGSLPQSNQSHAKWSDFWRAERILPQLQPASAHFSERDRARFEKLMDAADDLLGAGDEEGASLVHGDLWNGNVQMLANGGAALIDPSCYHGHREVDLAMSKLFGGFTRDFYRAYEQTWPLRRGSDQRLLMYQLYYLLVHVNLFGASYVPNTLSVIRQLGF